MVRNAVLVLAVLAGAASADNAKAFRVDVAPPAKCAAAAPCEAKVTLTALADYKVNEEYPFRFVADQSSTIIVDGARFARDTAKTGTLTIKFRAQSAGAAKVTGTFKLSVCTKDVCKIEAPKIAFTVPVT